MRWLAARLLFVPTLAWNLLLARVLHWRRWWDQVDDRLILGALPLHGDVPALVQLGVRAVVNTCEEYGGPRSAYEHAGIVQLRIPTVDFTPPRLADIDRAVAFIDEHVARGSAVYVHCKAGRARSATIALCWLVHARKLSPEAAQALLLEKRPHVHPKLTQRAVVIEFCRRQEASAGAAG